MSDRTKHRLDLAGSWANRGDTAIDLADGKTQKVAWAGKTLRLRVRAGRHGPRLELLPGHGSRLVSLFALGFLALHWHSFSGGGTYWVVQSVRAELPNPAQIMGTIAVAILLNLLYLLFVWVSLLDYAWSFEPHLATRRLNLLGIPVRRWTYKVIDARGGPDSLVLHATNSPDVAVRPTGWGSETDDNLMPLELRRLIRTHLALPDLGR